MQRAGWLVWAVMLMAGMAHAGEGIGWWDTQRIGANWFNGVPREQWLKDASAAGIQMVRLAPSKWKGAGRDFLLGDANEFKGIPPEDLRKLIEVLDWAQRHKIKVVVAPLSLPGARWRQQNDGKVDDRLWKDLSYHAQAAAFWKELAGALKDHPAVAGYNIVNEPCAERALGAKDSAAGLKEFYERQRGTAADVNALYERVVASIREVDARTPIVLDGPNYASVDALQYLEKIDDPAVIYSVHFYEPWLFTTFNRNKGEMRYGTEVKIFGETFVLDEKWVRERCAAVEEWAKVNEMPAVRIFIGEFGCGRRVPGAGDYLRDVINTVDEAGWHWAFYSYREDVWDGMDYELGDGPVSPQWELSAEAREEYMRTLRKGGAIWQPLAERFGRP